MFCFYNFFQRDSKFKSLLWHSCAKFSIFCNVKTRLSRIFCNCRKSGNQSGLSQHCFYLYFADCWFLIWHVLTSLLFLICLTVIISVLYFFNLYPTPNIHVTKIIPYAHPRHISDTKVSRWYESYWESHLQMCKKIYTFSSLIKKTLPRIVWSKRFTKDLFVKILFL